MSHSEAELREEIKKRYDAAQVLLQEGVKQLTQLAEELIATAAPGSLDESVLRASLGELDSGRHRAHIAFTLVSRERVAAARVADPEVPA